MKSGKIVIQAFCSTWALLRVCNLTTTNIITVCLFGLLLYLFQQIELHHDNTQARCAIRILSALFTFFYVCGDAEHLYAGLDHIIFRVFILLVTTIGLYFLFYRVLMLLFSVTAQWTAKDRTAGDALHGNKKRLLLLSTFIVCILAWLPYLCKNYPGIMTIDSMNQFAQVIGVYADSNHHPWVHTQVIKLFYLIGSIFTDQISVALSFYTIAQMCFMAGCVTYLVATLVQYRVNKWVLAAVIGFYALIPYNAIYAITIWKDTMFAGSVLLCVVTLLRLLQEGRHRFEWILYGLSGMMMCLFRTNGWYAFLIMTPFLIIVLHKQWKTVIPVQAGVILAVVLIKGPVMDACGVIQPDLVESLSIPIQQISKVIVEELPLTEEEDAFLNRILDTSKIKSLYNPYVSDGFKRLVRAGDPQYLQEHKGAFFETYIGIGLRYPKEYLLALRDQSIGYWFPTQEGLVAADEGVIVNEFGVTNMPIISGKLVIKLNEIALKLKDIVPGYGILWSMGSVFWIILIAMGMMYTRGDKKMLLLYIPCVAIFLTLVIATPVAKEFRYAYAYVYCLPLYLILPFLGKQLG
ncbi:MAG: DUF6020 family protein [Lachnospiraceae bacterium]